MHATIEPDPNLLLEMNTYAMVLLIMTITMITSYDCMSSQISQIVGLPITVECIWGTYCAICMINKDIVFACNYGDILCIEHQLYKKDVHYAHQRAPETTP